MNISDYLVYLWMLPVVLQIILPFVILCGWLVMKLPALLFGFKKPTKYKIEPEFAS